MYLNIHFFSFHFNIVKFTFINSFESNFYFLALLSFCFYIISICGLLFNLKNILISIFFIELTYFAIIIFFLLIAIFYNNYEGLLLSLTTILLAAAESAVGLGLVILIYSCEKKISYDHLIELA